MTATLSMVPLGKIHPSADNPRSDFDDERMVELIESVKRHGIITPLTLAPDENGGYAIIAGERRYRVAKAAKLREVPAQVREVEGEALTLAVSENVIRADLSPVEEARAYRRLVDEHGDAAKVAKLVGKSERLIAERLDLLRLPEASQELLAARVPLACAPALVSVAEREPLLANLAALWLVERPHDASEFATAPGEIVDDVLRAEWTDDGSPAHPVAYSVGSFRGPLAPPADGRVAAVLAKLGEHAQTVENAYRELPAIPQASERDWQARQAEERRERECFALGEDDADAARAFGCLLELPGHHDREHRYVTDPVWLADRVAQRIAAHAVAESERRQHERNAGSPLTSQDDAAKEERRHERDRQYQSRVSARSRNLDLGAAVACWQPKLDTNAIKLLGRIVLEHHGRGAAWAYRLCVDQPTTMSKKGKVTVRYPRGQGAETEHHEQTLAALNRARTPEDALAVVLRLLVAQRLADTEGLPNADRQGVYEPELLARCELIDKLARRVGPASVRDHLAEQSTHAKSDREEAREQAA